jgi:hypothetical protein
MFSKNRKKKIIPVLKFLLTFIFLLGSIEAAQHVYDASKNEEEIKRSISSPFKNFQTAAAVTSPDAIQPMFPVERSKLSFGNLFYIPNHIFQSIHKRAPPAALF